MTGENGALFSQHHANLVAEFSPNGAMEEEVVLDVARLTWRKKNLPVYRQTTMMLRDIRDPGSQLGSAYPVQLPTSPNFATYIEVWGLARAMMPLTLEALGEDLQFEERLDAMIDRCIKRLLMLRGVKSLSAAPTDVTGRSLPKNDRRHR